MIKNLIFGAFLFLKLSCFSQCLSGNCKNGFGKYDFGFAIYEGNFVAEKPNGNGTMDYGAGEKFVGNFKDGQEDGDGVLYKKNIPTNVTYTNGKAKLKEKQVVISCNIPKVDGCQKGDCYNGLGSINFDSGNRYEGNFVYGVKSGEGTFYFAGGNFFTGTFKDNVFDNGTFSYTNDGVLFKGSYNADGTPNSGNYYYETNQATVTIENGKITKVVNPVAEAARKLALEQSTPHKCSACGGGGMNAPVTRAVTTQSYYTIDYRRSDGSLARSSGGNVMNTTKNVTSWPTECSACNGTGIEKPRGTVIYGKSRY